MNWRAVLCLITGHKWHYSKILRWCTKCGWVEIPSTYPLEQEGERETWDWMAFPDIDLDKYFETPEEERVLADELRLYLDVMEERGLM